MNSAFDSVFLSLVKFRENFKYALDVICLPVSYGYNPFMCFRLISDCFKTVLSCCIHLSSYDRV